MRTLLVLLPVLFVADGGIPGGGRRPAAYVEPRRAFLRAFDSGALGVEHGRLGLVAEWLSWFDRPAAASATMRRAAGR